jgi:hypothetical protein
MATTLTRARAPKSPETDGLRLEPARRRRRPLLAIGSLVLVAASVAGFTSAYQRAGHQVSVLAIAQPVSQGAVLSSSDLTVVRISVSSGLSVVPSSAAANVIGRRVSLPLAPGTLLATTELSAGSSPPPGQAIVGVALKPGQFPAEGVAPGDVVDIVMTGSPDSSDTAAPVTYGGQASSGPVSGPGTILAPDSLVTDVNEPSQSSGSETLIVSLLIPRAFAPIVANASAASQAAVVIVAPGK